MGEKEKRKAENNRNVESRVREEIQKIDRKKQENENRKKGR